jgi:glycosyltransferase involved in cell wall biosynthesis
MTNKSMTVVISNGSKKFHLAPLAAEMAKAKLLSGFLTAGWPSGWMKWIAACFPRSSRLIRLLDRKEAIPDSLVSANNFVECFIIVGDLVRKYSQTLQQKIHGVGFYFYAKSAKNLLSSRMPDVYHYRNCYGRESVPFAQRLGIKTLCDHSIAHPLFLSYMVTNCGKYPNNDELKKAADSLMPLEKFMLSDLGHNDHLLVNSEFVKKTCVLAGMDPRMIHVVYWGIDEAFYSKLSTVSVNRYPSTANKMLFAGGWQFRKGILTLIEALSGSACAWKLEIAGGADAEVISRPFIKSFMENSSVKYHGIVPRSELAEIMKKHRIFVFPSYCEGSARVIFEALAAGCYVITTETSGSIVKNNVHGRIVQAGNAVALRNAIDYALLNPVEVAQIGDRNALLIRDKFRQIHYRENVLDVYQEIIK